MREKTYSPEQEQIYIDYLMNLRKKGFSGEHIPDNFPNKPIGFIEWLKNHPDYQLKLKKTKAENIKCWNCDREYPENYRKCPFCHRFNPNSNKNR